MASKSRVTADEGGENARRLFAKERFDLARDVEMTGFSVYHLLMVQGNG